MEYKKTIQDVKKAIDSVKTETKPALVTANSPGVVVSRALKRLEKVASA